MKTETYFFEVKGTLSVDAPDVDQALEAVITGLGESANQLDVEFAFSEPNEPEPEDALVERALMDWSTK